MDEGRRDVFFFQGLADEAAEDDAFVAVEPGEVIDVQGLFITRVDVPQEASRVIVEVDVQFAAGLFDHVRRGPGVFAAGDVRTKQLRQIITAAADGANCVTSVEKYLISH